MVSSFTNTNLLREVDALVGLLQEACKITDIPFSGGKPLAEKVTVWSEKTTCLQLTRFTPDSTSLKNGPTLVASEIGSSLYVIRRSLMSCKERSSEILRGDWKRAWPDGFWGLVREVKGVTGDLEDSCVKIEKPIVGIGRREKGYESARFTDRLVIGYIDTVRFSSRRFSNVDRLNYPVEHCIE